MAGIYVHIPFCKSRCIYCGFYSSTKTGKRKLYVDALLEELKLRRSYLREPVHSIYIGGGTPSQLAPDDLTRLELTLCREAVEPYEFTMECNPDDVTEQLAQWIGSSHINRVSLGVQSFDDNRLRLLHRRHSASQARMAVQRLRDAGISNISIDLMFGFPSESLDDWKYDLDEAIALNVEHISAYSLMYEEGTTLYKMVEQGGIKPIDEELSASMYDLLIDTLADAGYQQYEISNFCKPGHESKHNSNYWNMTPYLGVGAGAHSYDGCQRCWNPDDLDAYIDTIGKGMLALEYDETSDAVCYNDLITTALRTRKGISLAWVSKVFGERFYIYLMENAKPHLQLGSMAITDDHLHLTRKGLYVSDDIMSDLIYIV